MRANLNLIYGGLDEKIDALDEETRRFTTVRRRLERAQCAGANTRD